MNDHVRRLLALRSGGTTLFRLILSTRLGHVEEPKDYVTPTPEVQALHAVLACEGPVLRAGNFGHHQVVITALLWFANTQCGSDVIQHNARVQIDHLRHGGHQPTSYEIEQQQHLATQEVETRYRFALAMVAAIAPPTLDPPPGSC